MRLTLARLANICRNPFMPSLSKVYKLVFELVAGKKQKKNRKKTN